MTTFVAGATGATGKQLVDQLLTHGDRVKVLVRPTGKIPDHWIHNENVLIIKGHISGIGLKEMADHLKDCQAVASCLGHNLTMKGIYGKPRKLVTDAVQLLCNAIQQNTPESAVKFVLMNTAGNGNRNLNEPVSFGQKIIIGLIRILVPPHADNEKAADYLRTKITQREQFIEWVVVRPDTLIDEDRVTEYDVVPSPTRSAIFNPGTTSRINVANFMSELISSTDVWKSWKGQMPVIYNKKK